MTAIARPSLSVVDSSPTDAEGDDLRLRVRDPWVRRPGRNDEEISSDGGAAVVAAG